MYTCWASSFSSQLAKTASANFLATWKLAEHGCSCCSSSRSTNRSPGILVCEKSRAATHYLNNIIGAAE
jgi:hypothetical protein